MQQQLRRIEELVIALQALLPMQEETRRNIDKKIRLEFNYNSNHIEGNTLTYGETELLLIFGKTAGQHEWREYEEMEAHDVAFRMIQEWAADEERPLTEMAIKNLNQTLLVKPYWKDAETQDGQQTRRQIKVGDYKEHPNHVRLQNGEIFYYATPAETPIQMGELISWYRKEDEAKDLHPVALAALLHYKFVRIHPFDDGNGRISRLLMNYVLLRYALPPVVIKSVDKKGYLFALNRADAGDIEAFITYIAEQLIWSLELYIKAAKGESQDEPGDLDKKLLLLKRKLGEDLDAKVELQYSEKAFNLLIQNVIIPIITEWEIQLKKFELFFNSRTNYASINDINVSIPDDLNHSIKILITSIRNLHEQYEKIKNINLSATFEGLRHKSNKVSIHAGELDLIFNNNTYEIDYTGCNRILNKLYSESLTEQEIKNITESLGNRLYIKIEEALTN